VLHRNEISGALTGLTRVRRFQQDDSHIFCMPEQIEQEVGGVLDFLHHTYGVFGFDFSLALSTRPANFMGEPALWNQAEAQLQVCLERFCKRIGKPWSFNHGDGAFYGPKIDIRLFDALRRQHQCATVQLDFQLPLRFRLQYKASDGSFQSPVMIHRAILGSVERFLAVLIEHTAGNWPFWLSPRQCCIVPVSPRNVDYARQVARMLVLAGFYAEVDDSRNQLSRKIVDCFQERWNYIAVVGAREQTEGTVTLRCRETQDHMTTMTLQHLTELFAKLRDSHQ